MLWAKFSWNWSSGSGEDVFSNFINVYSLYRYYPPMENGTVLRLRTLIFPLHKDVLCHVWLDENVKSLQKGRRTDRQTTDNRRSENLTWAFRSGELIMIDLPLAIFLNEIKSVVPCLLYQSTLISQIILYIHTFNKYMYMYSKFIFFLALLWSQRIFCKRVSTKPDTVEWTMDTSELKV